MKNTIKLLVTLFIIITFNSCDKVEDLADVSFSTTLTNEFEAQVAEDQDSISNEITLNLDNSDTHDYLDLLKSVKIKKLTYRFKDFSGNEAFNMNVEISTDNNIFETRYFIIKNEVDNETVFEITDVDKLNAMALALKNNHQVNFKMEGPVSDGAANFKIEVTAEVDIVANPL